MLPVSLTKVQHKNPAQPTKVIFLIYFTTQFTISTHSVHTALPSSQTVTVLGSFQHQFCSWLFTFPLIIFPSAATADNVPDNVPNVPVSGRLRCSPQQHASLSMFSHPPPPVQQLTLPPASWYATWWWWWWDLHKRLLCLLRVSIWSRFHQRNRRSLHTVIQYLRSRAQIPTFIFPPRFTSSLNWKPHEILKMNEKWKWRHTSPPPLLYCFSGLDFFV